MENRLYEYYKTDDFVLKINEAGGHAFLHLEVFNWNKGVLKELRMVGELIEAQYRSKGYLAIFATTDSEKVLKFWNLVKPLDRTEKFGPGNKYYLGTWVIKEIDNGN